jgi:RES domain-containing protein
MLRHLIAATSMRPVAQANWFRISALCWPDAGEISVHMPASTADQQPPSAILQNRTLTSAWRICRSNQIDLKSDEACRSSGRWASDGRPLVYLSDSPALALLEIRVHLDVPHDRLPKDFALVAVGIPQDLAVERLHRMPVDTKAFGDNWLDEQRTALLRVPSVVVPVSANVLLNPRHPDAQRVTVTEVRPFYFDPRLWLPLG